jgi:predicted nucleic acid-binding protein
VLLVPDLAVATLAAEMAAAYSLKALDAVHLATAVDAGADAFVTNNRRDFKAARIEEIDVRFPTEI